MRKYIYIYNIAYLLIGNILFSNIHHLNEHSHLDDDSECLECEFYENNSNFYCENKLTFLKNYTAPFFLEDVFFIESKINKYFHSRAPPLSC